jgi:hypothetical protein
MKVDNLGRSRLNMRKANDVAGYINQEGYWEIRIGNTSIKISRIIWILLNGQIPDGIIVDHKDGNPLRNVSDNLQLLSKPANLRALNGPYSSNTSGFLGVFKRQNNTWTAAMRRLGKLHYLGNYSSPIFAARRYNQAVIEWAKAHGETPRYLNPV